MPIVTLYLRCCVLALSGISGSVAAPRTNLEALFSLVVLFLGLGLFPLVALLSQQDFAKVLFQQRVEVMQQFVRHAGLSKGLSDRIDSYYGLLYKTSMGLDVSSLLADLPDALRTDICMELNGGILAQIPLFNGATAPFLNRVVRHLRREVYSKGERIVRKGDRGHELFFLRSGAVDVVDDTVSPTVHYVTLSSGKYFGELAFFFGEPRTASVMVSEEAEVYVLHRHDLDKVLEDFPEFEDKIVTAAIERGAKEAQSNPTLSSHLNGAAMKHYSKSLTDVRMKEEQMKRSISVDLHLPKEK
jgi:CRP-like cAMP-binding protein